MLIGRDKVFILDFSVNGNLNVNDPKVDHVAIESDGAGDIPFA